MEQWKDIKGYYGRYQVSDKGRIKNIIKNRIHTLSKHPTGYIVVGLSKDGHTTTYRVHRLVGRAFIPNTENKLEINHINAIKDDNRVKNLEWSTRIENAMHAHKLGLMRNKYSDSNVLTLNQISEIKGLIRQGKKCKYISTQYGISSYIMYQIKSGRTWKHVS